MPTSLVETNSLLAVDVGASATRAVLFDVVEGRYRFIAVGQAPSTAEAPFKDIGLGVRAAIEHLQTVTGRSFLGAERNLIMPTQADGNGVDMFAATLSAGPTLKTAVAGLLSDVSVQSARRLAETTYARVVETFGLHDHRKPEEQIDSLLRVRPDLVILTGGTDGGASRAVQKVIEAVGLACYLLPSDKRPAVLFAGNQNMTDEVQNLVGKLTPALHFSPNVRPSLETEDLDPAMRELAQVFAVIRKRQVKGVDELETWSGGHVLPTAYGLGRMIRFLERTGSSGGVLGVDLGASAVTVAAAVNGRFRLGVYPQFGQGEHLGNLLQLTELDDILEWLSLDIHQNLVRDYLYQKALYPAVLPATREDQAIAQAVARRSLYLAMRTARREFPPQARAVRADLMPPFGLILAGGGPLGDAPTPGQSLLLLLDAVQPVGITHVMLDRNSLLPLLGVAAEKNNLLPVHVLESGALQNLGTVVSAVSGAGYGTPIVRARIQYADGNEARAEVKLGGLEILPLGLGQSAKLFLQPLHRTDVGNGPGRAWNGVVNGGALGVVIDARGRPLTLTADPVRRRELMKKWQWTLGG
ncbi:MAG: glutamate mutase L [Chloroflexota bacterium]